MVKSVNVAKEVDNYLRTLEMVRQFNDVPFLRIERQSVWTEQYANFILQFDTLRFDLLSADVDDGYTEISFDYDSLVDDFRSVLQSYVPGCKIDYREGCHEWEIIGPDYDRYRQKYEDQIEDWHEQHSGFSIFVPQGK